MMKTKAFSILALPLFCCVFGLLFARAADCFMPQNLGMYDTIYEYLYGFDCRDCHNGINFADLHHALGLGCINCHTQRPKKVDGCVDCHDGHDSGEHHESSLAASWACNEECHDPALIDVYDRSGPVPGGAPSYVTPRPYRCKACHNTSPYPPGPDDPNPPLVGVNGMSITTNTHHGTRGDVYNTTACDNCHDHTLPLSLPSQIRYCERCHSVNTLHNPATHYKIQHCNGCHADTVAIRVFDVWTTNWKGRPKKVFAPGSKIRFNFKFRIIGNPDVQHKVRVWGRAFGLPDKDWAVPLKRKRSKLYPGEYIRSWRETVPLDAVSGTKGKVRVKMNVVDVAKTPYYRAKFRIK